MLHSHLSIRLPPLGTHDRSRRSLFRVIVYDIHYDEASVNYHVHDEHFRALLNTFPGYLYLRDIVSGIESKRM